MLGQKNIQFIWHMFKSFPDKFVMYGVTIESPIESPVVSFQPLTHQVVEYRIDLTKGTYTLLTPTIYPGSNDLVRQSPAFLQVDFWKFSSQESVQQNTKCRSFRPTFLRSWDSVAVAPLQWDT